MRNRHSASSGTGSSGHRCHHPGRARRSRLGDGGGPQPGAKDQGHKDGGDRRCRGGPATATRSTARRHGACTGARRAARQPSAPAPTSGPAVPSPLGTMRASDVNDSRARARSSALAAAKNGIAETERHRPADHDELDVEKAGHRSHGPTHQTTRPRHHLRWCLGRRVARDRRDGGTRCFCFEASARPTRAEAAVGLDDHVSHVAGVPRRPLEQSAVDDDSPAHAGGHHHGQEVAPAARRPGPALGQRQRLGVVVQGDNETGDLLHPGAQREGAPRRDVERRHGARVQVHGTAATDPAHHDLPPAGSSSTAPTIPAERGEELLGIFGGRGASPASVEQRSPARDTDRRPAWCRRRRRPGTGPRGLPCHGAAPGRRLRAKSRVGVCASGCGGSGRAASRACR